MLAKRSPFFEGEPRILDELIRIHFISIFTCIFFQRREQRGQSRARKTHPQQSISLHSEKRTRTLYYGYLRFDLGMTSVIYQFSMNCWEKYFRSTRVCLLYTLYAKIIYTTS